MTWILGPHWAAEVGRMPSVNGPEKECVATQILRQLPLADKTSVWGTLGTIRPHLSFDVEKDVQTLLGTVSGRGVDYRTIIDLLTNRSNEQCQQIAKEFLDFTKQDLLTTLQAAVPANLEGFVAGLLRPAAQYDAHEIKAALKGPEVETLTEILCTRTNQQLREILRFYKNDFKSDFEKDVASGTSGWLKDLLVALSQGKRERYSGVIDYILIDQDTKVRYGLCGEVGRASVFARPVEGRPSPAEKRFPCSVKYRRCDKLRAKKLWGSSEERRRTQNSLRTKRALVDADGGGHAGKLQESEWVRILTQRSPEHLNRGKTASAMPRIALSICCERGEVVFSHVGILCNRFKWTRNEFPRNLESRTPDVALLLNQLACDVGTIFFLGTWELLNSNLVLFEAHPMWQTDISLLAEEIHKVFLVSRLRLWSDKTKRIPCLLETRSVQLAG
ncbi:annexin A9 isoform X7 [Varanus komodoensis]|uniref:annexin A9 isoform X7 n=1 Tax=Varanus komodoensis TaxID=61221 RepID=UPI001CF7901C|nr:annexin A9 isoform X7 [Varanus komodoensis]